MIAIFSVNHWKLRSTISRNNWLPLQAIADQAYWELLAEEEAKLTPEEDSGVIFGQWGGLDSGEICVLVLLVVHQYCYYIIIIIIYYCNL